MPPKWSNIIRAPGGGGADGVFNNLTWNNVENLSSNTPVGEPGYGDEHGFLPDSNNEYGPDGIPQGVLQVCYVKAWKPGVFTGGEAKDNFNSKFVAPFNMVLTKIKFRGRQDLGLGTATTWGAWFRVIIDNGQGARIKRIRPEIGHLRDNEYDIWDLLSSDFNERTLTLRPIVIPKGANVTIQLYLDVAVWAYATDWIRVGNVQIGYRAPMNRAVFNYNYGGQTKSWLTRKECLPEDSMRMSIRVIDAEGSEVGNSTPIHLFHGISGAIPLTPFPLFLSSEGLLDAFSVLGSAGAETIKCTSEDADGPEGSWLGLDKSYDDKVLGAIDGTFPDDDPHNNVFTLPPITDTFAVAKRTPRVFLDALPTKLTLGLLINFGGRLEDPEQPGIIDFLKNVNVRIRRNGVGLESQSVKSDGTFNILRTLSADDLGMNRLYNIGSDPSAQYNQSQSLYQSRTVWQIIQTSLKLLLDTRPPFLGTRFNLTARLADVNGLPLSGMSLQIFKDTVAEPGTTDQLGEVTQRKLLDVLGQTAFQAMFSDTIIDGYKDYQSSASEALPITVTKKTVNTVISRFELERPDILKGELATFHVSLTDSSGTPIGPTVLSLQRQVGTDWIDIKNVEIGQNGSGIATWDASDLLGNEKSVTIITRAVYDGGFNGNLEPWEYYNPSESSPRNLTVSALAPNLGHLILRAKLDNKYFEELPGTKTITFTVDPADVNNVTTFDHPQTVTVNPGRYNVDCSLTVEGLTFTKNDSRDVAADEEVLMEFSFMSTSPPPGTGRLNISIECTRTIINAGESFEVSGTVTLPSRLRAVPIRRVAVKIKSGDKTLETVRTDRQGNYSATVQLTAVGQAVIFAEISGPFGNINIAKSPSIRVVVV